MDLGHTTFQSWVLCDPYDLRSEVPQVGGMLSNPGTPQDQSMGRASESLSQRGGRRDHLVRHRSELPISLLCNGEHVPPWPG